MGLSSIYCLQGLTLVLQSCCGLQHQPAEGLLEALAGAIRLTLECFKRAELASCLDSFKALGFYPGNDLMQVRTCPACACMQNHSIFSAGHRAHS